MRVRKFLSHADTVSLSVVFVDVLFYSNIYCGSEFARLSFLTPPCCGSAGVRECGLPGDPLFAPVPSQHAPAAAACCNEQLQSSVVRYLRYLDTYRRYLRDDTSIAKVTRYIVAVQNTVKRFKYRAYRRHRAARITYHLAACTLQRRAKAVIHAGKSLLFVMKCELSSMS